jgi:hypothetical protein
MTDRARENMAYVRSLLRRKQPGFAAALESAVLESAVLESAVLLARQEHLGHEHDALAGQVGLGPDRGDLRQGERPRLDRDRARVDLVDQRR